MLEGDSHGDLASVVFGSVVGLLSITVLGGVFGSGLRYAFSALIGRFFGPEVLGIFAIGFVVVKGAGSFCRLGLDQAAKKFVPAYRSESDRTNDGGDLSTHITFSLVLPFLAGLGVIGFYFAAVTVTGSRLGYPEVIDVFVIAIPAFAVFITGVNVLYAFGASTIAVAIRDVGFSTVLVLSVVVASLFENGAVLAIRGYAVVTGFGAGGVLYAIYARRDVSPRLTKRFDYGTVLRVAVPLNLSAMVVFALGWSDIILLSYFLEVRDVGWYQAAVQTSLLLTLLPTAIDRVFPVHVARLHQTDPSAIGPVFKAMTKWALSVSVLLVTFVLLYDDELLALFDFNVAGLTAVLAVLLIGQLVSAAAQPSQSILFVTDYQKLEFANNAVALALNVALNVVLIPRYGILGAAAATAVAYTVLALAQLVEVRVLFGISPLYLGYWRAGLALALSLPVVAYASTWVDYGLVEAPIVGAAYLGTFMAVTSLLGPDDLDRELLNAL